MTRRRQFEEPAKAIANLRRRGQDYALKGHRHPIPAVQTWTPDLQATTTNPTRDNNGTVNAFYVVDGPLVRVWVRIVMGSGTAGSGVYFLDLPIPSAHLPTSGSTGQGSIIGSGYLRDDSSLVNNAAFLVQLRDAGTVFFPLVEGNVIQHNVPITWDAGDVLGFEAAYLRST